MQRTDTVLLWGAIAFGVLGLVTAIDLLSAAGSQSCASAFSGPRCYPWGAEGPAAGSWRYASKTNYLVGGIALTIVSLATLVFLVWTRRAEKSLTRLQRTLVLVGFAGMALLILI